MKNIIITAAAFASFFSAIIKAEQSIDLTNASIGTEGLLFVERANDKLEMRRFSQETLKTPLKQLGLNPIKAKSLAGGAITFGTNSKTIKLSFARDPEDKKKNEFTAWCNGKNIQSKVFFAGQGANYTLNIKAPSEGMHQYKVQLPMWGQPTLTSFKIDDGAKLEAPAKKPKRKYLAFGDSITHGVGQDFCHQSYATKLAKALAAELFNLAVGGAKVSLPAAKMSGSLKDVDLITILVGYNDLHFDKKSPEEYETKYRELINIVTETHPKAKIFCITPLFSKKPQNPETKVELKTFRAIVKKLVKEANNPNVACIEGDKITSIKNLRANRPTDPVHLGIEGADMLASKLIDIIKPHFK